MGFDGHEFEHASGVGDGQGSLACCRPWGRRESDATERLNTTTPPLIRTLVTGFRAHPDNPSVLTLFSCVQLHDPLDCSLPGCSIHGAFQARTPHLNTCKDPFSPSGRVLRYLDISWVGEQFNGAQDFPCKSSESFVTESELCRQSTEAFPSSLTKLISGHLTHRSEGRWLFLVKPQICTGPPGQRGSHQETTLGTPHTCGR